MAKRTESERFWAKVDRSGGPDACWPWLGFVRNGYGLFHVDRSSMQANRYAWISARGPIPAGLVIDHLCHNADKTCLLVTECPHRRCCNPAHLEPVTQRINMLRANRPENKFRRWGDRCWRGHHVVGDNLYVSPKGIRHCRACRRIQGAGERWRRRVGGRDGSHG